MFVMMMIHLRYWIKRGSTSVNWKLIKLTTQYTEVLCLMTVWVCLHEKIQTFTCKSKIIYETLHRLIIYWLHFYLFCLDSISISRKLFVSQSFNYNCLYNLDSKLKKLLTSNKFLWIRIVFLPKTTEALRSMSKKLENKIITSINLIPLNTSFEC